MKNLLLIFLGGGLGSVFRFILGNWINQSNQQNFPWGTLVVNIVACFTLGLIVGIADQKQFISPAARLFWTIGFCGGFSTFSTFSAEALSLIQTGFTPIAIAYICLSVVACLVATYGGLYAGELF